MAYWGIAMSNYHHDLGAAERRRVAEGIERGGKSKDRRLAYSARARLHSAAGAFFYKTHDKSTIGHARSLTARRWSNFTNAIRPTMKPASSMR